MAELTAERLPALLENTEENTTVQLPEGIFRIKLKISTPGLTIRGAGMDKTVIIWDDYAEKTASDGKAFNTFRTWTAAVVSDHVTIEDLTIANDAGHPEI